MSRAHGTATLTQRRRPWNSYGRSSSPAWALGWLVTSYVITANVKEQFAVFGGSGALVFGLLTWLLLAVLFRGTVAKVEERQAAPAR